MGIVGSKDESGKVVLGALPPGFLDYKGRDLRDALDDCLGRSMWMFTLGGLAVTVPICYKYKVCCGCVLCGCLYMGCWGGI